MLSKKVVEVWVAQLQRSEIPALELLLTSTELAQANRCRLPLVRQRKILARARLRQILSYYLDQAPQSIEITLSAQGKPQVQGLEFNLSHSEDLAVYAISQQPVGIDVEFCRALEMDSLVQRFFAPAEIESWQQLSAAQQEVAFFRAWTQKEAYLKAIGTGLFTPLSDFVVEMHPAQPCRLLATPDREEWQLESLDLPSGYVGVVAMAGQDNKIITRNCNFPSAKRSIG